MEIRIKTGTNLVCGYTGEEADVLVKLKGNVTGPLQAAPSTETDWIGRKALEEALRVIGAMDGQASPRVAAEAQPQQHAEELYPPQQHHILPPQREVPRPSPSPFRDPPELAKRFEAALVELIENPPPSHKDDGTLSEQHVRELIQLHKPIFQKPMENMFPVVARHLGMERQRFEMILSSKAGHGGV